MRPRLGGDANARIHHQARPPEPPPSCDSGTDGGPEMAENGINAVAGPHSSYLGQPRGLLKETSLNILGRVDDLRGPGSQRGSNGLLTRSWTGRSAAWALLLVFVAATTASPGASPALNAPPPLVLHRERSSAFDLEVTGSLTGVAAGEARYLKWSELRALPTTRLNLEGEFVSGSQEVTVVLLADLLHALPIEPGVDAVLATCSDGYASIYPESFISRYRPFLVLEINGRGPDSWPPPGLKFNPGPYVITVSSELIPAVAQFRDIGHKKPWGVTRIELASLSRSFRGIFSGPWAHPSPAAAAGREIWIHSCASCHAGPPGTFGGSKAGRPFGVIAAYAASNPAFFKKYVRDPKSLVPSAQMEAHPRYTDAELDTLIALLTAH